MFFFDHSSTVASRVSDFVVPAEVILILIFSSGARISQLRLYLSHARMHRSKKRASALHTLAAFFLPRFLGVFTPHLATARAGICIFVAGSPATSANDMERR